MSAGADPAEARFGDIYRAFNDRDADWLLEQMTEDVDWPNGWEGGRVLGRAAVRSLYRITFPWLMRCCSSPRLIVQCAS